MFPSEEKEEVEEEGGGENREWCLPNNYYHMYSHCVHHVSVLHLVACAALVLTIK